MIFHYYNNSEKNLKKVLLIILYIIKKILFYQYKKVCTNICNNLHIHIAIHTWKTMGARTYLRLKFVLLSNPIWKTIVYYIDLANENISN